MSLSVDNRILRDMAYGVVVLDLDGTIRYINAEGAKILNLDQDYTGIKYVTLMEKDADSGNDEFHQTLLDAVYKKDVENKVTKYIVHRQDGEAETRYLNLTVSMLKDENSDEYEAAIIHFNDITKTENLKIQRRDSTSVLTICWIALIVVNFVFAVWTATGRRVHSSFITYSILLVICPIAGFLALKKSSLTFSDIGLSTKNLKRNVIVDSLFTVAAVGLMVFSKFLLMKFAPESKLGSGPLIDWSKSILDFPLIIYPISTFIQELFSRGFVFEALRKVYRGKHSDAVCIAVSSLFFGAVHIHMGLTYMILSAVLLTIFGVIYIKQKSIWGLCIPHYVLGVAMHFVGFAG